MVAGTPSREYPTAGVMDANNDVIVLGASECAWIQGTGTLDYVGVKLDGSTGAVLWRWQGGSIIDDFLHGAAMDVDGMLVIVATSDELMSVFKIDPADMEAVAVTAPPSTPQPVVSDGAPTSGTPGTPAPSTNAADGVPTSGPTGIPVPSANAAESLEDGASEKSSLAKANSPSVWLLLALLVAFTWL